MVCRVGQSADRGRALQETAPNAGADRHVGQTLGVYLLPAWEVGVTGLGSRFAIGGPDGLH